jgi:hypothetical protein
MIIKQHYGAHTCNTVGMCLESYENSEGFACCASCVLIVMPKLDMTTLKNMFLERKSVLYMRKYDNS